MFRRCRRLAVSATLIVAAFGQAFAQRVDAPRASIVAQAPTFMGFNLAEREAFRHVADEFIAAAVAGDSAKVVANVLVDSFVEGRHCAFEAGAWRCPDFR